MKIHILGGPGSGKTTLARTLAAECYIQHFDFDQLGHQYGSDPVLYLEACMKILKEPGWVTEGIYLLFVDHFLEQADFIVLLDVPWSTAATRIVKRHIVTSLRGTNQYPGLSTLIDFLGYARTYYLNQRPDAEELTRAYLSDYAIHHPATDQSIMSKLENYRDLVIPPTGAFVRQYLEPYRDKVFVISNHSDQRRFFATVNAHCSTVKITEITPAETK